MVQFLAGEKVVSLLVSVQTSSGAHRASCSVGTGGSCPGHRVARAWGHQMPRLGMSGTIFPLQPYAFMTSTGQLLLHALRCGTTVH